MTSIQALAATEHRADLHRAAAEYRHVRDITVPAAPAELARQAQEIDLRVARPNDGPALRRLAILDEDTELDGPVLLALVDGVAVAALSLADGRIISDPFVPTRDAMTLLRLRARHITIAGQVRRRRRLGLRPRLV